MFAAARFEAWDEQAAEDLVTAMRQPAIDAQPMAEAAASLLLLDPVLAPAIAAFARGDGESWLAPARVDAVARPLLIVLLNHALVTDGVLEAFLTRLRATLLYAWRDGALVPSRGASELLLGLAQQCFLNEYVWDESPPEGAALAALELQVHRAAEPHAIALYGAYRPLADVAGLQSPPNAGVAFASMWRRLVEEPREERGLRGAMPALTPVADDVSRSVREQYERNPYPRWLRLPANLASPYPVRQALRALFPDLDMAPLALPDVPDILVAGCGTGFQTAVTASRNPRARILAVDLSLASLAYAQRRARELGLANVEFAQADILGLASLERRFHVIECTGVLHHLRDPLAGWRVLRALLHPGGVMKVGLYSELGRRGVVEARALAERHALQGDVAGVRELRRLVRALPDSSAARALSYSADFASASGARDLMLHVQEHRFTTDGIASALAALGLEFLGFELGQPELRAAYRARFPEDPGGRSLERWGRFEAEHPDAFGGMYQFWVAATGAAG
jgi:SAM-dependent methyltransferase